MPAWKKIITEQDKLSALLDVTADGSGAGQVLIWDDSVDKYTPATHIPILSSQVLKEQPVDAVIVLAASYSDEVATKVQQIVNKDVGVSILRDHGLEEIQREI